MLPPNHLDKLQIRKCEVIQEEGADVFHVYDPHALVQASGYLKFKRAKSGEGVYFRGQTHLHRSLSPSLFRKIGDGQAAQSFRVNNLKKFISEVGSRCRIFSTFSKASHEPLLQHYGLSTTWLDLVDNIWVALWFACHTAQVSGENGEYLHFERREPRYRGDDFAYIILIAADANQTPVPGLYKGANTELVDLRVTCPSIFLRPHAQHGLLFRVKGSGTTRPTDYSTQVRGTIRISLSDALKWLGDATTLGVHTLFPPAYYDQGYKLLLDERFGSAGGIGAVQHVGA